MHAFFILSNEFKAFFYFNFLKVASFTGLGKIERKNARTVIIFIFYIIRAMTVFTPYSTAFFFRVSLSVDAGLEFFFFLSRGKGRSLQLIVFRGEESLQIPVNLGDNQHKLVLLHRGLKK